MIKVESVKKVTIRQTKKLNMQNENLESKKKNLQILFHSLNQKNKQEKRKIKKKEN